MRRTLHEIDGDKLSKLRDERGWNIRQFAAEVGVSEGYMGRLEKGERQPSPAVRKRITEVLGVPLRDVAKDARQLQAV